MEKININNIDDLKEFFKDKKSEDFYFCNFYISAEPGWIIIYILTLSIYLKKKKIYDKGKIIVICLEGTEFLYQILDIDYLLIINLKEEIEYWRKLTISEGKKDMDEKKWKKTFYVLNRYDVFNKLSLINEYLHKLNFKKRINDHIIMNPRIKFDNPILNNEKVKGLDLTSLKKNNNKKYYELLIWSDCFYTFKLIYGYGTCYKIDYKKFFSKSYSGIYLNEIFSKIKNGLNIKPKIKDTKYITFIIKNTKKHPEKNTPISLVNKIIKEYYEKHKDYKVLVVQDILYSKINILPNVIELNNNNFTFTYQNLYEYIVNSETIYAVSAMFEFSGFLTNSNIVIMLNKKNLYCVEGITKNVEDLVRDVRGKKLDVIDENNNKYMFGFYNGIWKYKLKTNPNSRTYNA